MISSTGWRLIAAFLLVLSWSVVPARAGAAAPPDAVADIRAALRAGRYAAAESLARGELTRVERADPRQSAALATLLDLLTESLWRGGKAGSAEAEKFGRRALRIRVRTQGADHPDLARSLLTLGTVYLLRGGYDDCRSLYERALAIREAALGPDHLDVAAVLNNLATLERMTGRLDVARAMYERTLAIRLKALGPAHADVGAACGNLAVVLMLQGDLRAARTMIERDVSIAEAALGPHHPQVMQACANLGIVCSNLADYDAARLAYEKALTIVEATQGPDHPETAQVVSNLGVLFEDMGDYAEAAVRHRRALAIREKTWGPEHRDVGESLLNLAAALGELGAVADARALAERGVRLLNRTIGADNADLGHGLGILAALEAKAGDRAGAREHYERALAILTQALGADHYKTLRIEGRLGALLLDSGAVAGARLHLERALGQSEKQLGADHPALVEDRRDLARAEAALGRREAALAHCLAGEETARRHLRFTTRGLAEREALRYARRLAGNLDVALALLAESPDPVVTRRVWDAQIRSRALVFDALAGRHRGEAAGATAELDTLRATWRAALARQARLIVRGPRGGEVADYARTLRQATLEREAAERTLARGRAGEAEAEGPPEAGLAAVQEALPGRAALVAFSRYEGLEGAGANPAAYLAFITGDGARTPRAVALGGAAHIDSLVTRWRRLALAGAGLRRDGAAEAACRAAGDDLRRAVWDPLGIATESLTRLFLVPDGALALVNFAALPAPGGGFLIEAGPLIHHLSTERDLGRAPARPGGGLLVVGDPDYDAAVISVPEIRGLSGRYRGPAPGCPEFERVRFERLPATRVEAEEVRRHWGRRRGGEAALALSGAGAEEGRVKTEMSGRRVLHLATHGFFLGAGCSLFGAGRRGVGGLRVEGDAAAHDPLMENPLRVAGLALAGANRRRDVAAGAEDGILSADEIAGLDLRGVEWSVLSACDTGLGDIESGEGVFGLRRAFELAGSATVVMSLWPVDDDATRAWMKALYSARLEENAETAESVRRASLDRLREQRRRGLDTRPSAWGAFIATGEWR